MSFLLRGKAPTSYYGEFFKINVWSWHMLWSGVQEASPDGADISNWYTNSGELVDAEKCLIISNAIKDIGFEAFSKLAWSSFYSRHKSVKTLALKSGIPPGEIRLFVRFMEDSGGFYIE